MLLSSLEEPVNQLSEPGADVRAAVQQVVQRICPGSNGRTYKRLIKLSWGILLGLDAAHVQELQDVQDRQRSNRIAAAQACLDLQQSLRTSEAEQLQQLLQEWQGATQYQPWTADAISDWDPTAAQQTAQLSEHQAVLSLLLHLRGTDPPAAAALTALPPLGSSTVAAAQQHATAAVAACSSDTLRSSSLALLPHAAVVQHAQQQHVPPGQGLNHVADKLRKQQHAATAASWLSPAAAATQILQEMPLSAAADTTAAASSSATVMHTARHGASAYTSSNKAVQPLVECLVQQLQLASQPTQLRRHLQLQPSVDAFSSATPSDVNRNDKIKPKQGPGVGPLTSDCRLAGERGKDQDVLPVTRTAEQAAEAVAAAAEVKPGVLPLMLLSDAAPGHGAGALVNLFEQQQQQRSCTGTGQGIGSCHVSSKPSMLQQLIQQQQEHSKKAASSEEAIGADSQLLVASASTPAAARAAAEEELVGVCCLAVQGVWSAVGTLWNMVAAGPDVRNRSHRLAGLNRPAAQQHLLVQVLHIAELRLRLHAFLQNFANSNGTSGSSAAISSSQEASDLCNQPVQQAFLTAVKETLDMHDAAFQVLQHQQQQRKKQLLQQQAQQQQGATSAPAMTLLQLVMQLRSIRRQLQQLAECCWCTACIVLPCNSSYGAVAGVRHGFGCQTTTQRLLDSTYSRGQAASAAAVAADAAAAARAAALPWPASAAVYADAWGWDPSTWQVQHGFMQGRTLVEHLYEELLHAGPQSAPLLRHLFAASVQPLLHVILTWSFQPNIHAAEAAAAAATMRGITPASGKSSITATVASSPEGCLFRHPGSSSSSSVSDRAVQAAASALLLQAWTSAQERAPICPSFLGGVQQVVVISGLQLQLLQLLGGPGQYLAERLGWLAELERDELCELLESSSSSSSAPRQRSSDICTGRSNSDKMPLPAAERQQQVPVASDSNMADVSSSSHKGLALLLGGKAVSAWLDGKDNGANGQLGLSSGRIYLPFSLNMRQLKHAAAVVSDYEAARQQELARVVADLAESRAAAAAAQQTWLLGREQDKAAAQEQRMHLQQAAAARKRERQQQLLLQQQEEIAAAAVRQRTARQNELVNERSLLAVSAAAEHKAAMQQLQDEIARVAKAGLDIPLHLQQRLRAENRYEAATGGATATAPAAAAYQWPATTDQTAVSASGSVAAAAAPVANKVPALDIMKAVAIAAAVEEATATPGSPCTSAAATVEATAVDKAHEQQQQPHRSSAAACEHKRPTWSTAPIDPSPAAGVRSGIVAGTAAAPLAVIGSAAAAAAASNQADMPAAGRRSNSAPRVKPGYVSVPASPRDRGSDSGVTSARQQQQQRPHSNSSSKWGVPIYPAPAAGQPSQHNRRASWAGSDDAAAASVDQQQQQQRLAQHRRHNSMGQTGSLLLAKVAEAAAGSATAVASVEDVLVQLMDDTDGAAATAATAAAISQQAGIIVSKQRWQQQNSSREQQQQQQQTDAVDDSSAPLITMLEVLVVRPLLSQHRLTTLACWQLLLQDQLLLQRIAAMQALFFQQQGDWVGLLLEGFEQQMQQLQATHARYAAAGDTAAAAAAAAAGGVRLSPVAAQLLLESAVQQSCLSGAAESERMSLLVASGRTLPGWSSASSNESSSSSTESATDALLLAYEVPWPVSLLVGDDELQQYAAVFSVLLRLRRLQQQLVKQWTAINSRTGSGSSSTGSAAASQRSSGADKHDEQKALKRLQQLRRWHAMALHAVSSILGGMLSELSGKLWVEFETTVSSQPVSLPAIIQAHGKLLSAAQQVCLLPLQQRQQCNELGGSGADNSHRAATEAAQVPVGGRNLAGLVYEVTGASWQLQQQVQQQQHLNAADADVAQLLMQHEDVWQSCAAAGARLEGLLFMLKKQLAVHKAEAVGQSMAGLGARLGVQV